MTTWGDLKASIGDMANDPALQRFTSDAYLRAGNAALIAFAVNHTPYMASASLIPDSSTTVFSIPDNMIETDQIYGVQYDGKWLETSDTFGGGFPSSDISYHVWWSTRQVVFSSAPLAGKSLTIHYGAYYEELTGDDSVLSCPRWANEALSLYAAARLLESQATKMALLGNFKQKTESGQPTDNPLLEVANHYIKVYWQILGQRQVPRTYGV